MKLRHVIVLFLLALASRESIAATDSISVTVDTLCDGWMLHVSDIREKGGIEEILINDPIIARFDAPYPYAISYQDTPKSVSVKIFIEQHFYHKVFYVQVNFKVGASSYPVSVNSGVYAFGGYEIHFEKITADSVVYRPTSIIHGRYQKFPLTINTMYLTNMNPVFSLDSIYKPFPITIQPGDTFSFRLKYHAKYKSKQFDSIVFVTDCYTDTVPVVGGYKGIISATDIDLGSVMIGEKNCGDVLVSNYDVDEFNWLSIDTSIRSTNYIYYNKGPKLPITMKQNNTYKIHFCYEPKIASLSDTLLVKWQTDTDSSSSPLFKNYSIIRGSAYAQSVKWQDSLLSFTADTQSTNILTTRFFNSTLTNVDVRRFYIYGQNSGEFSIHNSLSALSNVTLLPKEVNWFDIAFKPDMTKPLHDRYADRHAKLIAELKDSNVIMELVGKFNPLHVNRELALEDVAITPNPVFGQDAMLSFALAEPKQLAISIYDILGREVISIPSQYYSSGSFSNIIATSKLGDGSYILRVSDGSSTKSIGFRVVK